MSEEKEGGTVSHPWLWFPEFWELGQRRLRPQARLLILSLLVGVVAGVGAIGFFAACQVVSHYSLGLMAGYHPKPPGGEPGMFGETGGVLIPWMLLAIPTIGGLLSGVIVYTLAPEAEGHGTDAAIDAYHNKGGKIRGRVPIVKMVASALTLGTGGSGGREGPIAQIGAGFGSFLGKVLRLRPGERRVLMAAGMGAGIAAIFKAPLAGALFAAEVLYRSPDFESEVIIPAGLASVTAYCTFGLAFGWGALFVIPPNVFGQLTFTNPWHLIAYTGLALCLVVMAMLYTRSFYWLTHLFHKVPIKPHFKPMIGALMTGLTGVGLYYLIGRDTAVLSVLSFGYGILQTAITLNPVENGTYAMALVLAAVAFGKILTTGLTIGSGGSGGVFGPSMVIGGCAGGALGIVMNRLFPGMAPHPASCAIIGMAGFFAAAAKTPFSTLIIVSEMTGGYNLLLPTLWVCTIAFLLSDEQSIYRSQIASPALSPAHQGDYIRAVLRDLFVRQFVKEGMAVPTLQAGDEIGRVVERLGGSDCQSIPVISSNGNLLGVVNLEEVHAASLSPHLRSLVLASDLMRTDVVPLQLDDRLDRAVELFAENDLDSLPVVDSRANRKVVGLVKRSEVAGTYLRHVHGSVPV